MEIRNERPALDELGDDLPGDSLTLLFLEIPTGVYKHSVFHFPSRFAAVDEYRRLVGTVKNQILRTCLRCRRLRIISTQTAQASGMAHGGDG